MVDYNLSMDMRKYGLIAAGVGASVSAINLARGLYIRYNEERYKNYPAAYIFGDSIKRGVIFGGVWPITAFMGVSEFMNSLIMIGLRPSGDLFTPIDYFNMYYHINSSESSALENVSDDNETWLLQKYEGYDTELEKVKASGLHWEHYKLLK